MRASPTPRLVIGLVLTLVTIAVFFLYSLVQLGTLRQLQKDTIDRTRIESQQLLRIQNDLNATGLAIAEMYSGRHGSLAWVAEFSRVRDGIVAALGMKRGLLGRDEGKQLATSLRDFSGRLDRAIQLSASGSEQAARELIHGELESQHHTLSAAVGQLLVRNSGRIERATNQVSAIYAGVETNLYLFAGSLLAVVLFVSLVVLQTTRSLFARLAAVSEQKSTLAQRLIGIQEEVFRAVSRELHDDFGQIMTAVGAMLQRAGKAHANMDCPMRKDLDEVKLVLQDAIERARSFSQALHPTILDDYGLERAIDKYLPAFEKQTGVSVQLEKDGFAPVSEAKAIHVYRILQEALTNVAKHSRAASATVRLRFEGDELKLQVQDDGVGINGGAARGSGLGLIGMKERAELVNGELQVTNAAGGGTLVELKVPLDIDE